ncbi:MAG: Crp/Fnr family transcriptional regulator [Gammaproteobacteria bacterium]|nr:MAG: Crp/Fnr family transcriptional regulator [Gammaproteobacteria bacterium]
MPPGFPPGFGTGKPLEQRLLKLFRKLDEEGQGTLLAFAEFLASRKDGEDAPAREPVSEPLDIPRPKEESVPAAIRRLAQTYPMINRDSLFHQTSALMAQHVMQGRPAEEVIDELEALFAEAWRKLAEGGE